jgi:MarR family transcriptional regulator, 2-MHQ and catechol-resistance regulon repressor
MATHYKGSAKQKRALNAYITLVRAANTVALALAAQLDAFGLTISQFGVLEALYHLGPLCQHEIARKLLKSGGNMTLVIDNLAKQGWVRRERQPNDRRIVRVHLTPEGRRQTEKVLPEHIDAIVAALSPLTERDQEQLRKICRKFGKSAGHRFERMTTRKKGKLP